MKRILFLFLPFLPYLASAQVAKDTVTVLTLAQIPAGAIRDTTNITFVQDNAFNKARFDSLARYVTSKLIGDRGDVDVSGATGLNWTLDTNSVVTVDIVDSAVTARKLGTASVGLASSTVTGTLPVTRGGTNNAIIYPAKAVPYWGTNQIVADTSRILFDATNQILAIGTSDPRGYNANQGFMHFNSSSSNAEVHLTNSATGRFGADGGMMVQRGTNMWIGNMENGELFFFTNNTDGAKILANLNFLIGHAVDQDVNSRLQVNGAVRATAYNTFSDGRYKENILPLEDGIQVINSLKPVTYNFNTDSQNNFSNIQQIGFIAQDVDRALSTKSYARAIVKNDIEEDPDSPMTLSLQNVIPLLVKAIQEQQAQIEALKTRITQLENK